MVSIGHDTAFGAEALKGCGRDLRWLLKAKHLMLCISDTFNRTTSIKAIASSEVASAIE